VADRDELNDSGKGMFFHGRCYTEPFGSAAPLRWSHVQMPPPPPRRLPGDGVDPRFDSAEENDGTSCTSTEARVADDPGVVP
jgi:hypothetical protein